MFNNADVTLTPVTRILDVGIELETGNQALVDGGEVIAENLQDGKHNVETGINANFSLSFPLKSMIFLFLMKSKR